MAFKQHPFTASRSTSSSSVPLERSLHKAVLSSLPASKPLKKPEADQKTGYTFLCTVCWTEHDPPPHTFGHQSRMACVDCWKWIHNNSICWRCGEVVFRKTDAVRFGWCWWHWSCFSCLICASPLPPPSYLDVQGHPHKQGMITQDPPVCSRCRSQPESIPKLEQHVKTSPVEPESIRLPRDLLDGAASVVSISRPLDPKANKIGPTRDGPRWMPPWMALLPSRRTSTNHDSEKSGLSRHSTVPARIARAVPSARLTPLPKPTDSTRGGLEQRPAGTQVPAFLPDAHFDGRDTAAEAVELLNTTPDESMDDGVPAGLFLRRTSLKLKRRYPLRKHSERESNGKSPRSCTPEDISPTNTSLVRELSGFFSDRADKEKLILPSRVGETSTRPKAQIDIGGKETPNVATRNCDRCGADLPDITSRTYPLSKKQQRTCQICEAERTTPGAWT